MPRPSTADDARPPLHVRFGAFELDEAQARLSSHGEPLALAPKAFGVLCALARQAGQLVTKDALLDAVWGHQHVSDSVLKTTISELRAVLSDDARQPRYIETASRRGYRFIGRVDAPARMADFASVAPSGMVTPAPPSGMVGRVAALARLRRAWDMACGGQRQTAWVVGEAGVGKTTLIDALLAGLGPVQCARGQCVEQYGAGEPYLPVLEALSQLCRQDASLVAVMRAVSPTWLLQLPWLSSEADREALRREVAGTSQERMLREFAELVDRIALQQPLLIVTEDLHWADHATVALIDHVTRRRGPLRLMWLASFRLAEVVSSDHPMKPLRHELRLHRLCEEVLLDPFSEVEVADYVCTRFPGSAFPESFVRSLHAHTDGLPLFLVNVVDDMAARGTLDAGGSSIDDARLQVPESLAGVMETQIARLPDEQQALLEAASVCGVEFRSEVLALALQRDPAWVQERCEALARQQQWIESLGVHRDADDTLDARYAFRHALYRKVFHQRLGALARARLHRAVAQALQACPAGDAGATAAELASHFELGEAPMDAMRHYVPAVDAALNAFAPQEAMQLTTQALALVPACPDGTARAELELALVMRRGVAGAQLR